MTEQLRHIYKYFQSHVITLDMIYFLTAIGLTPGGRSTVLIYTQTIHRTTKSTQKYIEKHS